MEAVRDVVSENCPSISFPVQSEPQTDWLQVSNSQISRLKKLNKIKTDFVNFFISGGSFTTFREEHRFSTVSIYGFSELGDLLYRFLDKSEIRVRAVLDKKVTSTNYGIAVYNPENCIPDCDLIIVTVINQENGVIDYLEAKTNATVMTLSSLLLECMKHC